MTLKEYIRANGLSLTQFGQRLGVTQHAVRKWVYGQRRPDLETLIAIERETDGAVSVAEWAA